LYRTPGNFGENSNAVRKAGLFEILVTQEVYNIFPTVKSALLLSIVQNSIGNYSIIPVGKPSEVSPSSRFYLNDGNFLYHFCGSPVPGFQASEKFTGIL